MNYIASKRFWLLIIPFLVWMFIFRFFLSGQGGVTADAVSYFDHIGFFTDHLARGQYPLWDPFWYDGAPYHFFLRRIGEFNPFYLIIVLLKIVGVSHPTAYLIFLTLYYALAMSGFYLLVKYILKNDFASYIAYLLLLFSSWGTQLFYNYIILLFVPLIWFFYFFIRFIKEQRIYQWLGLCFCLAITLTTYIPFYFLTILSLFLCLMMFFYFRETLRACQKMLIFFVQNKILVCVSLLFLIASAFPGYVLYQESKNGEFVMPARASGADIPSAVAVGIAKVASGDFINNSSFDKYFGHLDKIMLGDFFIPYFFLFLLILSCFAKLNRIIISCFVMMSVLLLITITESSLVHQWLFKHIFFFKFIRNIYYFFWLAILPLSIFWVCACIASILNEHMWLQQRIDKNFYLRRTLYGIVIVLIVVQAGFVYHDLTQNMKPGASSLAHIPSNYKQKKDFILDHKDIQISNTEQMLKGIQSSLYYANKWYAQSYDHIDTGILSDYGRSFLRLYDNTQIRSHADANYWKQLEDIMGRNINLAFIESSDVSDEKRLNARRPKALRISPNTHPVQWVRFGPNEMHIKIKVESPQFLLISNNFDSNWHARINNHPIKIIRANHSYQGLWLSVGENDIRLSFAKLETHAWHWSMLIIFTAFFIMVIYFWVFAL